MTPGGIIIAPPPPCEDVVTLTTDPASGVSKLEGFRIHFFDPKTGEPLTVPRKEPMPTLVALSQMNTFQAAWLMERFEESQRQVRPPGS